MGVNIGILDQLKQRLHHAISRILVAFPKNSSQDRQRIVVFDIALGKFVSTHADIAKQVKVAYEVVPLLEVVFSVTLLVELRNSPLLGHLLNGTYNKELIVFQLELESIVKTDLEEVLLQNDSLVFWDRLAVRDADGAENS